MNNLLIVVPVIIPSQPLQLFEGFKSFLLLFSFLLSIIFAIQLIIYFIRSFKK